MFISMGRPSGIFILKALIHIQSVKNFRFRHVSSQVYGQLLWTTFSPTGLHYIFLLYGALAIDASSFHLLPHDLPPCNIGLSNQASFSIVWFLKFFFKPTPAVDPKEENYKVLYPVLDLAQKKNSIVWSRPDTLHNLVSNCITVGRTFSGRPRCIDAR